MLAQGLDREVQPRLDGAERDPEHLRDLLERQVVDEAQAQDLAALGGQAREQAVEVVGALPWPARIRQLVGLDTDRKSVV